MASFIVLFSAFLPGVRLRWFHILGVFLGFAGVFVLVGKDGGLNFDFEYARGYFYAFLCALIWSIYSVLSRYFGKVSVSSVGAFCAATAILAAIFHFAFEPTVIPDFKSFLAILVLGLGPVGGAFFLWDYGVKNGDIQMIGTLSYITPLLSTVFLVIFGLSKSNPNIWIATSFIALGSVVASLPLFKKFIVNYFTDDSIRF